MTGAEDTVPRTPSPWLSRAAWRRTLRDRPLIPLLFLLAGLVAVLWIAEPGLANTNSISATIRFAIPLAILAASQTLTMLTGGIDLSVATVASMTAFIVATQAPAQGPVVAIVMALVAAVLIGLINGIGVGIFRVHPLIMTLGMSLVVIGLLIRLAPGGARAGAGIAPRGVGAGIWWAGLRAGHGRRSGGGGQVAPRGGVPGRR